jgi:hypothetical protein
MTDTFAEGTSADLEQELDLLEPANVYPRTTGLPMTIWASPRGRAPHDARIHDARIKVCVANGDRMDASNLAVVAVRPEPQLLHGDLQPRDWEAVRTWVGLNESALLGYWDGVLDTAEFIGHLRKL